MISSWEIFWLLKLDVLCCVFVTIFIMGAALMVTNGSVYLEDRTIKKAKYLSMFFGFISLVSISTAIFMPSTKQAAIIYLLPRIANNEEVQKLPSNATKLLNAKLQDWVKDEMTDKDSE